MEQKRFIGNDMPRLYERVRREFGPDAIIVRTRSLLREGAEPLIELIASPPPPEPELDLDLQWKMVDGALGRLQIARPRVTVGDLEDIAEREAAMRAPLPAAAAPVPAWDDAAFRGEPLVPDDYVSGPSYEAEPAPPAAPAPVIDPFTSLAGIPDVEAAPPAWTARPRPVLPRRGAAPPPIIDFAPVDDVDPLVEALCAAGITPAAAERVSRQAPAGVSAARALVATLASFDVRYPAELETAIVTMQGPPGAGRTTALLRMALDCADAGREAVLVSADTTRAAAREQLHAYAGATGLPVFDATAPEEIAALLTRVHRGACLFVDVPAGPFTAPRVPRVRQYAYVALPAHWQFAPLERELRPYTLASFAGCVFTAVDLATDLSPAVSLAIETGMGVAFLSSGRDISTGIEPADPVRLASGILPVTSGDTTDGRLVATA